MEKLAIFISNFFSSSVWILMSVFILLTGVILNSQIPITTIIMTTTIFWFPIIVYFLTQRPDLETTTQRVKYLGIVFLATLAATAFCIIMGPFFLLRQILLSTIIIVGLIFLMTPFWKISLHAGFNSLVTYWVVVLWGKFLIIPFFVVLVLISCSRVLLKKHSPGQVIMGIILPLIVCGFVRKLF